MRSVLYSQVFSGLAVLLAYPTSVDAQDLLSMPRMSADNLNGSSKQGLWHGPMAFRSEKLSGGLGSRRGSIEQSKGSRMIRIMRAHGSSKILTIIG